ncbi:MAG: hypothetical protein H0U65_11630 [Rubrobacter sp.]|nr:hypothetical protein [Rubrobacter sp.]
MGAFLRVHHSHRPAHVRRGQVGPRTPRKGTQSAYARVPHGHGRLVQGAGAVVSMGGYNTTTELLAARKPAVIIPRVEPRVEQLIRARRLSALGLIEMIHPEDLAPDTLRGKVEKLIKIGGQSRVRVRVDLSGASKAVQFVRSGAYDKQAASEAIGA